MAGWRILYLGEALARWETRRTPEPDVVIRVLQWFRERAELGPPADAVQVWPDDELCVARVPETETIVSYLAVDYERLLIVKDID